VRQEKAADNSVDIAGRQHEQRKIRRLRVIKLVSKPSSPVVEFNQPKWELLSYFDTRILVVAKLERAVPV
jgi:hypothetical protein